MSKEFEIIEHTADIRIRISGRSLEGLFINAAKALFSLLTDSEGKELEERTIVLKEQFIEDLLVNWLNELISQFFTYHFIPSKYNVEIGENNSSKILKGKVQGSVERDNLRVLAEIKAATYHNLQVAKSDDGFQAEVIFDV